VIALVIETAYDGADGPPMTTAIGHALYFHSPSPGVCEKDSNNPFSFQFSCVMASALTLPSH
jgi:hypothetical protein